MHTTGQVLQLSQPATVFDATYFLINLSSPTSALDHRHAVTSSDPQPWWWPALNIADVRKYADKVSSMSMADPGLDPGAPGVEVFCVCVLGAFRFRTLRIYTTQKPLM